MTNTQPAKDVVLSVNGFDEIAIAKYFGAEWTSLQDRPTMLLRALMFVLERRGGSKDGEAFKTAMNADQTELNAYFPDDTDPDDTDEESNQGKAGAPSP